MIYKNIAAEDQKQLFAGLRLTGSARALTRAKSSMRLTPGSPASGSKLLGSRIPRKYRQVSFMVLASSSSTESKVSTKRLAPNHAIWCLSDNVILQGASVANEASPPLAHDIRRKHFENVSTHVAAAKTLTPIIFQDCTLVISLLRAGKVQPGGLIGRMFPRWLAQYNKTAKKPSQCRFVQAEIEGKYITAKQLEAVLDPIIGDTPQREVLVFLDENYTKKPALEVELDLGAQKVDEVDSDEDKAAPKTPATTAQAPAQRQELTPDQQRYRRLMHQAVKSIQKVYLQPGEVLKMSEGNVINKAAHWLLLECGHLDGLNLGDDAIFNLYSKPLPGEGDVAARILLNAIPSLQREYEEAHRETT